LVGVKLLEKAGAASSLDGPVPLRLRPLGGRVLCVRPGTSDIFAIAQNFLNVEPRLADRRARRICELGSNIGVKLAKLAVLYPDATLLGIEADPANAALARRNVAQFGDRCTVVQAAVWDHDTELVIEGERASLLITRKATDGEAPDATRVRGRTVSSLLAEHMPEGPIDFMHLSVQGAEARVLAGDVDWIDRVRSIKVSLHPDVGLTREVGRALLRQFGFQAWTEPGLRGGHALGVRDRTGAEARADRLRALDRAGVGEVSRAPEQPELGVQ
jgi:FkbM family methyltransferase